MRFKEEKKENNNNNKDFSNLTISEYMEDLKKDSYLRRERLFIHDYWNITFLYWLGAVVLCLILFLDGLLNMGKISDLESSNFIESSKLDYKLEDTIIKKIKNKESINLSNLADISFDKISICPFNSEMIDKTYKLSMPDNNILEDNFNCILFKDEDGKVVKASLLNKKYNILDDRSFKEFTKENAIFKLKKIQNDNEKYELEKQ
ncbi:TPA: hypothetical protein KQG29_001431 [Clostridioides difficile]|nr:hypothetical protein [Clostridioides difficile]